MTGHPLTHQWRPTFLSPPLSPAPVPAAVDPRPLGLSATTPAQRKAVKAIVEDAQRFFSRQWQQMPAAYFS